MRERADGGLHRLADIGLRREGVDAQPALLLLVSSQPASWSSSWGNIALSEASVAMISAASAGSLSSAVAGRVWWLNARTACSACSAHCPSVRVAVGPAGAVIGARPGRCRWSRQCRSSGGSGRHSRRSRSRPARRRRTAGLVMP